MLSSFIPKINQKSLKFKPNPNKLIMKKIVTDNKLLSEEVAILKYKIDAIEQHNHGITVEATG
ncbi:hypothetical protein QTP88_028596 [Uroleucon formosanum]